jgi:rubrerythrin
VRHALEIELGGRDFYTAAAAATPRDDLRDLFTRLARMEAEHLDTLVRRYHVAAPHTPGDGLRAAERQTGHERHPEDPFDLLELAIELERRAEQWFRDRVGSAGSPRADELYRELAAEEAEHVDLLVTELAAMRRGTVGLLR